MIVKLIVQTGVSNIVLGAILFAAAGRLDWPGAWVFLVEMGATSLAIGLWLARHDPGLLKERMRSPIQKDQTPTDRRLMALFLPLFCAWLVLMGLDARFGWLSVPLWAQVLGALAIPVSMYVVWRAFRENSFAAPVVKIQKARGQTVVTTGPYSYVRHPMYAGALLLFAGAPLLLGSWWGLAGSAVMTAFLAVRIPAEEQALMEGLDGYDRYAAQVRYRLVPGLW